MIAAHCQPIRLFFACDFLTYLKLYGSGLVISWSNYETDVSSGTLNFPRKELVVSDIDKLSILNVRAESNREYVNVASMRLNFLAPQCRQPEQFTVRHRLRKDHGIEG